MGIYSCGPFCDGDEASNIGCEANDTVLGKGCDGMGHKDDVRMDKRCAVNSIKLCKQKRRIPLWKIEIS